MKKLYDAIKALNTILPAVYTADVTSPTAVDTKGFNSALAVISAGAIDLTSTNETYAFALEESADGSTNWTAVSGATATVTASNQLKYIDVPGVGTTRKRYLRVTLDVGGTTPSIAVDVNIVLGNAFTEPVNS